MASQPAIVATSPTPHTPGAAMALIYRRSANLYDEFDTLTSAGAPGGCVSSAVWRGVIATAAAAMRQAPADVVDLRLALGIAATWINTIADVIPENDPNHSTVLAIEVALENATLFLATEFDGFASASPEVEALLAQLVAGVKRCGAQTEQVPV